MSVNPDQIGNTPAPEPPAEQLVSPVRPLQGQRCPNCGAVVGSQTGICAVCGETLHARPRKIRCRQCGAQANSQLVLCPHCGRELHAAPPRVLTWGAPALIAALLLVLLITQAGSANPLRWLQRTGSSGMQWVDQLSEQLDPRLTIGNPVLPTLPALNPDGSQAEASAASSTVSGEPVAFAVLVTMTPTDTAAAAPPAAIVEPTAPEQTPTETPLPAPTDTVQPTSTPTETPLPTSTMTPLPTQSPTPLPTATLVATANVTATLPTVKAQKATPAGGSKAAAATLPETTATATATSTPTASPTATSAPILALPTPTSQPATPTPEIYVVQAGDTALGIALKKGVELEDLLTANNLTTQDVRFLRPGQQLIVLRPASVTVAESASLPTQTPNANLSEYEVRPGDTILGIADKFDIQVDSLLLANNMTLADAPSLRPGQLLKIPRPGAPPPPATATPAPTPKTPTATPPAPLPTATVSALRLDAPALLSPENGANVGCASSSQMAWAAVPFIRDTDRYRLHLGYVSTKDAAGNVSVAWVIQQLQPANQTSWNMDISLCALAPQELGRQWQWYVEVVEPSGAAYAAVSPPSPTWTFVWK